MLWLTKRTVLPLFGDALHLAHALLLKLDVPHGKNFIHDENLGIKMRGHCECQPDIHPAGIALDRGIEEFLHLGKCDDLIELPADLGPRHPQDGSVEIDVLPAGQLGMESRANLE